MMSDDVAVGVYSQMSGHGFDNTFPKMYGHVRVSGPAFKEVPEVEKKPVIMNTEMYNLFCSILGLTSSFSAASVLCDKVTCFRIICCAYTGLSDPHDINIIENSYYFCYTYY